MSPIFPSGPVIVPGVPSGPIRPAGKGILYSYFLIDCFFITFLVNAVHSDWLLEQNVR